MNPEEVVRHNGNEHIEDDISPDDSVIPPTVRVVDIVTRHIVVREPDSAVTALRIVVGVLYLPRGDLEKFHHVILTRLIGRRVKDRDFRFGADDESVVQLRRDHAADPVGERREAILNEKKQVSVAFPVSVYASGTVQRIQLEGVKNRASDCLVRTMKFQKPGSAAGLCITPQNSRLKMVRSETTAAAVSASRMAATVIWAKDAA